MGSKMSTDRIAEAAELAGRWVRSQRFGSRLPSPQMEAWFRSMASVCSQVEKQLRLIRMDGALQLEADQPIVNFLRFEISHGLLAILDGRGYGWTNALEEFCDPLWRKRRWPLVSEKLLAANTLGAASAELADALSELLECFRHEGDWERVGAQMRRVFVLVCRQLILVEAELARMEDLEQDGDEIDQALGD